MNVIKDISYGNEFLDIYLPDKKTSSVFLYLHGGGFTGGNKDSAEVMAPYLTDRGIAVVSANYRLYPKVDYPDYLYDAAQSIAWTKKYMRDNLNCEKLYVGGSSAGGYATMMLCFDKRYLSSVGLDNNDISGYFHDAGQPTTHFNILKHKGLDPRRVVIDESAPLYYIGLEPEYPPMRFIVSDDDRPSRYEQTMLILSTLAHFEYTNYDHIVMHGKHIRYVKRVDEDGESAMGKLVYDFIKKVEE